LQDYEYSLVERATRLPKVSIYLHNFDRQLEQRVATPIATQISSHLSTYHFWEECTKGKMQGYCKAHSSPKLDNVPRCRQTPAQDPQPLETPKEPEEKMEVEEAEEEEEETEADT